MESSPLAGRFMPPDRRPASVCVAGLGSTAGDDRAGWLVIDQLLASQAAGKLPASGLVLARCGPPADLLHLLPVQRRLVVVDACAGSLPPGQWVRLTWPAPQFTEATGGHNLSLSATLELVQALGLLPPRCEVWCLGGAAFAPGAALSPEVEAAARQLAARLAAELADGF